MADLVLEEKRGAPYPTPARIAGRPTKYHPELAQAIAQAIEHGGTRTAAAHANGVNIETLRIWMETHEEFSAMIACAEAKAELAFTETVYLGGTTGQTKGDWRPAVEWLKRRRRADYGDTLDIRKVDAQTLLEMLRMGTEGHLEAAEGIPQAALTSGEEDI